LSGYRSSAEEVNGAGLTSGTELVYNLTVPRVQLLEQPAYEFHYEFQVQIGHLTHTGRVGHGALVRVTHEARVHLFDLLGAAENDFGDNRTGIIMADLAVTTAGEASLFDRVRVESHLGEMGRSSFRLFHRFAKGDLLIALVETGLTAFDYKLRTIVPVPEVFRKRLREYLAAKT